MEFFSKLDDIVFEKVNHILINIIHAGIIQGTIPVISDYVELKVKNNY
ncbi:MAG: hypothetical protein NTZ20_05055 [Candidatus Levybacteria bacterium]|nr:hypothetical protein [Candidatus Levybacteria bacterium]